MQTITAPLSMQQYARAAQRSGQTIGFVPTMGYLHEGHLSLIRTARRECDCVVLSIYVNPLQFGPSEDLSQYPRDAQRDTLLASEEGVDCIFYPSDDVMYPDGYSTYVTEQVLSEHWCGASRPEHFRGVTTIVTKLFNCVMPDTAYFGAKDIQQALIIKKMASDLNMPVNLRICPIVREYDGLAMSSRNVYLSDRERTDALILKRSLDHAQQLFERGERSSSAVHDAVCALIGSVESARIDYAACVDGDSLGAKETLQRGDRILLAVYIGRTRLIDNIQLN